MLASLTLLPACATVGNEAPVAATSPALPVALLLPLSGPLAEIGASMRRAAELAQSSGRGGRIALDIRDTGGDAAIAAQAAAAAVAAGTRLILGPLTAGEVRAVSDVAGAVPVIGLSNDPALLGSGAYVFGVTPVQSVAAVLTHARDAGLSSVAAVVPPGPYGTAVADAVETLAPRAGLRVVGAGQGPEAVLIARSGAGLTAAARDVRRASDAALLGTVQWLREGPPWDPALDGAVFAAPEPDGFAAFAASYGAQDGASPGLLAALAFDVVRLAQAVAGGPLPQALHRATGFVGVTGRYRLYPSGLCERELGVLRIEGGRAGPPDYGGAS